MSKRMPPFHDNCTSTFPRTMRHDGRAIYYYKVRNRWGCLVLPLGLGSNTARSLVMEKFLKRRFATIYLFSLFTPLLAALVDMFLWFLFNFTLLNWDSGRIIFTCCWALLPCPIFFNSFCEVMYS